MTDNINNVQIGPDAQGPVIGNQNLVNQTFISQYTDREIQARPLIEESPYKGLQRFEEGDTERFFGRENWIHKLNQHLQTRNLLLLLGASGSGKSSVIRAGLIPKLRQEWGSKSFVCLLLTPDEDPFESLYGALLAAGFRQSEVKRIQQASPEQIIEVIRGLKQPEAYWLVFIDQFEELFTLSRKDRRAEFVTTLVRLLKAKLEHFKLVLAMRADFSDRLGPYPDLGRMLGGNIEVFTDMSPAERKTAISEPAARHGVLFEAGLVDRISDDFGKAGSLPLLQYVLNLLWENDDITDRELNTQTYIDLGGVEGALQKQAEKIFNEQFQTKAEQETIKEIFLFLVDVKEGRTFVSRRTTQKPFRADERKATVMGRLIESCLLMAGETIINESKNSTVEVAHEALLTAWKRLKEWIEAQEEEIFLKNRLMDDALVWEKLHRKGDPQADAELWSGSKLQRVLELREQPLFRDLREPGVQFILAGVEKRDRLQTEAERRRRRTVRIALGVGAGMFGLAVVSGWGFFTANQQRILAEEQRSIAEEREVTAEVTSQSLLALNFDGIDRLIKGLEIGQKIRDLRERGLTITSEMRGLATLREINHTIREKNRLEGHRDLVYAVQYSPDGTTLASASGDNTVKLWNAADGSLTSTLKGHSDMVYAVQYSPDGTTLVSASDDTTVKLWNFNLDFLLSKGCTHLEIYLKTRPQILQDLEMCHTPERLQAAAPFLVQTALNSLDLNTKDQVTSQLQQALEWDPNVDLNPATTQEIERDPKQVVQELVNQRSELGVTP